MLTNPETEMQANSESLCGKSSFVPSLGCAGKTRGYTGRGKHRGVRGWHPKLPLGGLSDSNLPAAPSLSPRLSHSGFSVQWSQRLAVEAGFSSWGVIGTSVLLQFHSPPSLGSMKKSNVVQNIKHRYFWLWSVCRP